MRILQIWPQRSFSVGEHLFYVDLSRMILIDQVYWGNGTMGDAVRLKKYISCIISIPCCFWCGCAEMHLKSVYDWCSMIIKNNALKSFLCTILLFILKVFNLSNNITVIQVNTLIDWLFDWLCLKPHHQYFSLLTPANRQEISRRASYLQNMLRNSEIYRYAKKIWMLK